MGCVSLGNCNGNENYNNVLAHDIDLKKWEENDETVR